MNRTIKRTDRRARISGVETLEGRKLMAGGLAQFPLDKLGVGDKPTAPVETAQIVTGPVANVTPAGPQRTITGLTLKSGGGQRGTGSFNLSESSPMATTIEKAIAAGRSAEVEFRVKEADGAMIDRVLDVTFTSIAAKRIQNINDPADRVTFTYVDKTGQTPLANKLAMLEAELETQVTSSDPLAGQGLASPLKRKLIP
jgi:hypothetical protein